MMNILSNLMEKVVNMPEQMVNISRQMETLRKNQKEVLEIKSNVTEMKKIKSNVTEMKSIFDGLSSRLNMVKARMNELEDILIEISKTEKQREKEMGGKNKLNYPRIVGQLQKL